MALFLQNNVLVELYRRDADRSKPFNLFNLHIANLELPLVSVF